MPWDFALILFALAVLVPWRGAVRIRQLLARPAMTTADRLALYASTIAFQWLAVAVAAWRAHAHALSAARLALVVTDPDRTVAVTVALSLFLGANQFFSLRRLARLPASRQGFLYRAARQLMPRNLIESLAFGALAVTAGLCEEFLYRGFVFVVLQDALWGSLFAAALGSSALFAAAHAYQGRRGMMLTFVIGLVFAGVRIYTQSLAPSIVAHVLGDLLAGLAGRLLVGDGKGAAGQ